MRVSVPWRYSKAIWTWSWTTWVALLEQGLGPDSHQRSLPISAVLWFCDTTWQENIQYRKEIPRWYAPIYVVSHIIREWGKNTDIHLQNPSVVLLLFQALCEESRTKGTTESLWKKRSQIYIKFSSAGLAFNLPTHQTPFSKFSVSTTDLENLKTTFILFYGL